MKGEDRAHRLPLEEFSRFFSIQMSRYLELKPNRQFSGPGEYDAVSDIIKDVWIEILFNGIPCGLNRLGREALYHSRLIIFPDFVAKAEGCYTMFDFIGTKAFVPDCPGFDEVGRGKGQTDTKKKQNPDTGSI